MQSGAVARSVVDQARGVLMERLGFSPAEAQAQLTHLSAESGTSLAELAAQITGQQAAARLLLWQADLLWRRRIIDYLLIRAVRR